VAISINPSNILDVLALLLRRKKERKEKVVEYVESIAAEATSLATVWQKIFDEFAMGRTVDIQENLTIARELDKYAEPNGPEYARLLQFYNWVTVALGDKLENHFRDSVVSHLSGLLYYRQLTVKRYRDAAAEWERRRSLSGPLFSLSSDDANIDLKDLADLLAAVQREAAALHVLAKTIQAAD